MNINRRTLEWFGLVIKEGETRESKRNIYKVRKNGSVNSYTKSAGRCRE
jgi:hypothetical protein